MPGKVGRFQFPHFAGQSLEFGEVVSGDSVGFGYVAEWETLPAVQLVVPGVLDYSFLGGMCIWSDRYGPNKGSKVLPIVCVQGLKGPWSVLDLVQVVGWFHVG